MLLSISLIHFQVPALMDTVACQCFINRGMLTDLLTELAGDDGRSGRTLAWLIATMNARCALVHLVARQHSSS